ncbi:potassium channel family protein [Natranaerofaba carboxydovora]|uniref:potassium channel family protein n=1 Tax=Natranaerofaba carboxydovora TaxID=2742683 RepID=UPI001F134C7E|nr:TrkA family potassium uptake protein [Natranaerofaba carboxydovora]UMZ74047.1 Ktr system potassium uptake protein A [Natranaerofaba carboxydovora]
MKKKQKQFAVIGMGRFGQSVANTLFNTGYEVLAIDNREKKIEEMAKKVTHTVQADATDEKALRSLGLRNFDVVIIAIGDDDINASIMTTLLVKEQGVQMVVAKANSENHGKILDKVGADRVVFPERDMGVRVAHNLECTNILDHIELTPEYSLAEIEVTENLANKSLKELDLRAKYGINVLAIKNCNDEVNVSPGADVKINRGDILIAVGKEDKIKKIEEI